METIADLGEDQLLARVFPLLPAGAATLLGPGDDAAVLAAPDARVVVTTDVLVQGRHFRLDWSDGYDVGWRAATANLADVAAMGAVPTALVVALVLPPTLPVAWVTSFARGLAAACPSGVGVVGGDLSGGREVVVSVTAMGDLQGRAPVLRSGARPGDVVAHAGVRGRSAAGHAALEAGRSPCDAGTAADAVVGYLRPVSPLAAGVLAAEAGATAMLDVSDGLLRDAGRLARASGVVVHLDDPVLAFADDAAALSGLAAELGEDLVGWLLTGGEDHGLLATFPPGAVCAPFRVIGRVVAAADDASDAADAADDARAGTVLVDGRAWTGSTGWDHFRR